MAEPFYLKQNDTLPILTRTLFKPDGSVQDLTGISSVKLHITLNDGTKLIRDMTVDGSPTLGKVKYAWISSDWDAKSSPDLNSQYAVGGLVAGPELPLDAGESEHRMEYEALPSGGGRLTFPNGGLNKGEAYDILRIWPDLGQG